jgi:hypothetical protein
MIENETQETIEKCEIDLLVHFGQYCFYEHVAFALTCFPDVSQVVNALAPLE